MFLRSIVGKILISRINICHPFKKPAELTTLRLRFLDFWVYLFAMNLDFLRLIWRPREKLNRLLKNIITKGAYKILEGPRHILWYMSSSINEPKYSGLTKIDPKNLDVVFFNLSPKNQGPT